MPRRPLIVAASLSLLILLAKLAFPVPALSDPTGAALPAGVHLAFPVLNWTRRPLRFFGACNRVALFFLAATLRRRRNCAHSSTICAG